MREAVVELFSFFPNEDFFSQGHFRQLERLCPDGRRHCLRLLLDFAPALGTSDVPDPYYGGPDGFEIVLDMIEAASIGLLAEISADRS